MPRTRTPVRTAARPLAAVALTMAVLTTGVLTTNALTARAAPADGCRGTAGHGAANYTAASHGGSDHGVAVLERTVARLDRRISQALGQGHAPERSCPAAVTAGRPGTRSARPRSAPWPVRAG
jgi:hypothetical protein